eukprot:506738_1
MVSFKRQSRHYCSTSFTIGTESTLSKLKSQLHANSIIQPISPNSLNLLQSAPSIQEEPNQHQIACPANDEPSDRQIQDAILDERYRMFRQTLYDLSYQFHGTLSDNEVNHPARNKRSRQCDQQSYNDAGKEYLESQCQTVEYKSNIVYYKDIDYEALKDMFKVENISRPADRGGFYFIYRAEHISYTVIFCYK